MHRFLRTLRVTACMFSFCGVPNMADAEEPRAVEPPEVVGSIEVLSSQLAELVDPDAQIEVLAKGFKWSEGPLWMADGGFLIFADIPRNTVYKWKEGEGLSVYLHPAGYTGTEPRGGESGANGMTLDGAGALVMCHHGDMRIARMLSPVVQPEPRYETIAGSFQGKRFNSPNDVVVHSSGAIYFTDPAYGREQGYDDPGRELDFQGVYRIAPDGEVTLLTRELHAPNGLAFAPDEKTLYVSDSHAMIIMAYQMREDGSLGEGRVLLDASERAKDLDGATDGLKVDRQGNLLATGPGGVMVIAPSERYPGKHLGTIRTGGTVSNCAFGDDGRTLYMTSGDRLCRVRLKTSGGGRMADSE